MDSLAAFRRRPPISVERQVQYWFRPAPIASSSILSVALYIWEHVPGRFFGFPDLGNGVKIALHHEGLTDPDKLRREVGSKKSSR
jgi:hypothetical protein